MRKKCESFISCADYAIAMVDEIEKKITYNRGFLL